MKNALVLVPHPDDEVFCHGILSQGYDVTYLLFTDARHDEWAKAHDRKIEHCVGLKDAAFYETKDAWRRAMQMADDLFRRFRPELVLIPARSHDRDHCFVNEIGRCMARENGNLDFPYEMLEYAYPACLTQGWVPDIFVGVPDYREAYKMQMWAHYKSQHKENFNAWFTQHGLREFDVGMGRIVGYPYAEGYKHVFSKIRP